MQKTVIKIGPRDNGRTMSLAEFSDAVVDANYNYELSRGVVVVSPVPNPPHFACINALRRQLNAYDLKHPGAIYGIAAGNECRLQLETFSSERHPDIAVYMTPPPGAESDAWDEWIPELVVEIVSPRSADRDYVEKREEYLQFGVREYWIFDADKRIMTALRRVRGGWIEKVLRPPALYRAPLFPGLKIDCGAVFDAK